MPDLRAWLGARPRAPDAKAAAGPLAAFAFSEGGAARWTPRDLPALAREGYGRNPVVYRCVRMVAEAAAALPLAVFEGGARAPDHPLQRLLDRPNPDGNGADLMESFFSGLQIAGSAYLEAAGEPRAAPSELYPLRPDRMAAVPGPDGWPAAWLYEADGLTTTLPRGADGWSPVLQLKLFNPLDDLYGQSPLQACAYAVDVHNAGSAWNKALLDNSARPSGALVYVGAPGERLSADQFERLKAELADAHTGAAAAGRPLLLEGGLDWKPMALTPAEMDFAEAKHSAAREIALAFGVPPQLLGIPGDATYSNYKEATNAFWRATAAPLAQRAARALEGWLAPRFEAAPGALKVAVDLDAAPAFADERAALWARLDAASFLTPQERRRLAGLGAAPDGEAVAAAARPPAGEGAR